jgi:hypothetical protein
MRIRWTSHVAHTTEKKIHAKFRQDNPKERNHLEDGDVDKGIKLKWILKK